VGLEQGTPSLVSPIEELLGRKSSGSCLEKREFGHRDPSRWLCGTLYPQKLALISPTSDQATTNWHFRGTCHLPAGLKSKPGKKPAWSRLCSEMSVYYQQTTWHYITDDRALFNHCCEILTFCVVNKYRLLHSSDYKLAMNLLHLQYFTFGFIILLICQ
jgi:hypothetical protein